MTKTERQNICIKKWLNANGRGIMELATGFGKTRTAIIAMKLLLNHNPNAKILVSVPSDILQNQWKEQLQIENITADVVIINTIIKNERIVDLLIIDEVHTSLSKEFIKIYKTVKFTFFIGLTGTLARLDGREQILLKKLPIVDKITVEEAIENNWLSEYRDYKVMIDVDLTEYYTYNQTFLGLFSVFNFEFNTAMKCATDMLFCNKYAKFIGINHKQIKTDAMIWLQMLRKRKIFVQSHPKKLELTELIINNRLDRKIITFSATIADSKKISVGYLMNSKITKSKNKLTIKQFNDLENSGILNTSKSADCGLDIQGLSVAIILSGNSSTIQKNQRLGRIIRVEPGKIAEVFTLIIKGTIEESWYNKASSGKEYITINEEQLKLILNNKSIDLRKREDNENVTYRF